MQGRRFDVLLHMQVAFRANWASRFIKAKRKIGFDGHRAKELHSLFINERVKPQIEPHVIEGFFAFCEKLDISADELNNLRWDIPVTKDDQVFANAQMPSSARILVIAAASSKTERNWLPERYAQIADYASSKGFEIVLCGGPADLDRQLANEIKQFANFRITDLVGKTTLKQMLACLKRASLVLAPDTGPAHMAVTQGTPVLGLYAHSNPKRTGPYLYQDYVVEVYNENIEKQFGKSVHNLRWGTRVKGKDLMSQITVDAVKLQFDRIVRDFNL
jgi:heptosyltransferase I